MITDREAIKQIVVNHCPMADHLAPQEIERLAELITGVISETIETRGESIKNSPERLVSAVKQGFSNAFNENREVFGYLGEKSLVDIDQVLKQILAN